MKHWKEKLLTICWLAWNPYEHLGTIVKIHLGLIKNFGNIVKWSSWGFREEIIEMMGTLVQKRKVIHNINVTNLKTNQ
jgi:hypothetical protein